jgi:hypothetical protein
MHPNLSALVKARFCLFLGYYGENIFKDSNMSQYYNLYIKFLVNTLTGKEEKAVFL